VTFGNAKLFPDGSIQPKVIKFLRQRAQDVVVFQYGLSGSSN
jgi:hypothetical protein